MSILKKLEKALDDRFRGIFERSQEGSKEAIELYRDALNQVAARATVGARGNRVFAFNRIRVQLRAESEERRHVLEALFHPQQLCDDIRAALLEESIATPASLAVLVEYPATAPGEMRLIFARAADNSEATRKAPPPIMPRLRLVILGGTATGGEFALEGPLVNVGRIQDVVDATGRIVRRNHLCFPEDLDVERNSTVSRAHAHLRYNAAEGEWRLFDDGSSMGTAMFRNGARVEVPPHGSRGVGLRVGDEIYFGSVRARLENE